MIELFILGPTIEPTFDSEHPIYVTNNSVNFQWKYNRNDCVQLNGFFSTFYIELKVKIDLFKLYSLHKIVCLRIKVTLSNLKKQKTTILRLRISSQIVLMNLKFLLKIILAITVNTSLLQILPPRVKVSNILKLIYSNLLLLHMFLSNRHVSMSRRFTLQV